MPTTTVNVLTFACSVLLTRMVIPVPVTVIQCFIQIRESVFPVNETKEFNSASSIS